MVDFLKGHIQTILHRAFFLDLDDRLRAEAVKAFEMIRDHSGLERKRAREAEGQARFRMWEQGFVEVCTFHGGALLEGGVIPATDRKVFQPFMRFEVNGQGIILGLASAFAPGELPPKNKSRLAAAPLNYNLVPRFDFDGAQPRLDDLFVLLVVSRDRERAGKIEEIAVGVVDSAHATFLFYEPLEKFLASEISSPTDSGPVVKATEPEVRVKLRDRPTTFKPPESPVQPGERNADDTSQ